MKKIFYILGLFLLLIPFKVNALTPESLRIFVDNSSLTNTSTNVWYGKTTLYINSGLGFYSGGASRIGPLYAGFPTGLGCNNTSCLVSGTFASYTPNGFDSSVFEKSNVYIEYGGKYNACTINRRYTEQSFFSFIDFSCSGKNLNSSGFNLVVDNFSSFYDKDTFYGIVTDVSIQDNISTGDIIDSQNNNTQSIIDNQNKNTNEIKESIGSMGSSINSNIDGMKEKQDQTNQELGDLNDNLTSEEGPNLAGLENSAGWLPAGPVDSILNLPLSFFDNLSANLGGNCQPITFTLPFFNENISLPCINTIYAQIEGLTPWINTIAVLISSLILFKYLLNLYHWVDDTLSFRENNWNDQDQWGGL